MKTTIFATAAAVISAGLMSCSQGFSVQTVEEKETFLLAEGSDAALEMDLKIEYPVSGLKKQALDNLTGALTANIFGEEYAGMDITEAVGAYKNDKASDYRTACLPLAKENEGIPTASLDWSDYVTGAVAGCHKNILSYSITKYSFTGGAHGMTAETALNFDMKTGNLLTESDFFKEGYKDRLPGLLSSHLAESLENPSDTSMLFTQEIGPNGNFAIGEKGVTYIYNQYEIGPYVMGAIRVTVPWEELEGLY